MCVCIVALLYIFAAAIFCLYLFFVWIFSFAFFSSWGYKRVCFPMKKKRRNNREEEVGEHILNSERLLLIRSLLSLSRARVCVLCCFSFSFCSVQFSLVFRLLDYVAFSSLYKFIVHDNGCETLKLEL